MYVSIFYQVLFHSHAQSKQNWIEHLLNMFSEPDCDYAPNIDSNNNNEWNNNTLIRTR